MSGNLQLFSRHFPLPNDPDRAVMRLPDNCPVLSQFTHEERIVHFIFYSK